MILPRPQEINVDCMTTSQQHAPGPDQTTEVLVTNRAASRSSGGQALADHVEIELTSVSAPELCLQCDWLLP